MNRYLIQFKSQGQWHKDYRWADSIYDVFQWAREYYGAGGLAVSKVSL